jgi:hypothetical protein
MTSHCYKTGLCVIPILDTQSSLMTMRCHSYTWHTASLMTMRCHSYTWHSAPVLWQWGVIPIPDTQPPVLWHWGVIPIPDTQPQSYDNEVSFLYLPLSPSLMTMKCHSYTWHSAPSLMTMRCHSYTWHSAPVLWQWCVIPMLDTQPQSYNNEVSFLYLTLSPQSYDNEVSVRYRNDTSLS